jgi:ElaB/YqjD/DUF883 family membrane-anchored ribosome-binding protein
MPPRAGQNKHADLDRAGEDLEQAREKFVLSLGAVEREIKHALDWREWVGRRPGTAIALAFALGFFLGRKN